MIKTHLPGLSDEDMGGDSDDISEVAAAIRADVLRVFTNHISRLGE